MIDEQTKALMIEKMAEVRGRRVGFDWKTLREDWKSEWRADIGAQLDAVSDLVEKAVFHVETSN